MSDMPNKNTVKPPNPPTPFPQRDVVLALGRAVLGGATQAAKGVSAATQHVANKAAETATRGMAAATRPVVVTAKRVRARVVFAWICRLAFLPVLLLTYLVVTSEGLRSLLDIFSTPLHKCLAPLAALGDWRETRRIDLAHLFSLTLLVFVWVAWERVVRIYVQPPAVLLNDEKLVWLVGLGLLALDATLFFSGVAAGGGFLAGTGASLFAATVVTGLYVLMLVFASYLITALEA